MRRGNRNHHAVVGPANFQGEIIARDLVIDLLATMRTAQGRFDKRHRVVRQQRQAKGKQRRFGIAQRIDLARQRRGDFKEGRLDAPPLAVELSQLRGRGPWDRTLERRCKLLSPSRVGSLSVIVMRRTRIVSPLSGSRTSSGCS